MTERLLQFIWQFQYFNTNELTTVTGDVIRVIAAGQFNPNQGPDFTNAKISIAGTTWAGSVELHIKTTDWEKHHHQKDRNYQNVILHVVWVHEETKNEENRVPVLELQHRVSKILFQRYQELMTAPAFIPCQENITSIADISWKAWNERLVIERLLRKARSFETFLHQSNYHWEESFWWLLARSFGTKVNASAFEAIAKSIPVSILAKHKNHLHQLEALLFGQAGLLARDAEDDYPKSLQREYRFLKTKYRLNDAHERVYFLRMRPGNFPTIRLAQLAVLVNESSHLFSKIKDAGTLKVVRQWFDKPAGNYWLSHYRFDEIASNKAKKTGDGMIDGIIINAVVPVLFAYGNYHNENKYKFKAIQWLEETKPELNAITKAFAALGVENKTAYDSQALIELKNEYCSHKKCLDCAVGNFLLKKRED